MHSATHISLPEMEEPCERCMRGGGEPPTPIDGGAAYEVQHCAELGRYLVAARDLQAGELVFRSAPLVSGLQPGSVPLCLGCYRPLSTQQDFRCPTCGWPLCSEDCVLSLRHQPECEATARSGVNVWIRDPQRPDPLYDCVILIRCLMLKRQAPALWAQLASMEAHEERKRGAHQRRRARALCALLKTRFGIPAEEKELTRLLNVLEVNAYEVRMPATNVQAVYPVASLPEHNCTPNTFRTFERDMSVCVRAAVSISAGQHISVTYTDTLWGTPERRAHLYFSKHFLCSCPRCSDPTELGTCLTALRCGQSGSDGAGDAECPGPVLPADPLRAPAESEDEVAGERWVCGRCHTERSGIAARDMARRATDAVHELDDADDAGPEDYERLLAELHECLYPRHACIVDVKHTLLHLYSPPNCDMTQLRRKEKLCVEVLGVAERLCPGISQLKGTTLFELASTMAETCRRESDQSFENIGPRLKEAARMYASSLQHLKHQPECQPEWQVAEQAHQRVHELQTWIRELQDASLP